MMKWYLKSLEFSSAIPSELSLIEEFHFEQLRKSAGIPQELLNYSKRDFFTKNFIVFLRSILLEKNFFDLSLLLLPIYLFLNKTNDNQILNSLPEINFQQ